MDDFEDDSDQGAGEAQADPKATAKLEKELAKAREEAKNSRLELRKVKLEAEYGAEIVELIPSELPAEKWDDYAARLKDKIAPKSTEQTPEPPAPAEPTPQEGAAELAAIGAPSPASATQTGGDVKTSEEIRQIGLTNQAEAIRLIAEKRMAEPVPHQAVSKGGTGF